MSDKKAMTLALEALVRIRKQLKTWDEGDEAIKALEEALAAEQEQLGEPVAWPKLSSDMEYAAQDEFHILPPRMKRLWKRMESFYTTPPQSFARGFSQQPAPQRSEDTTQKKPWVGLTDDERFEVADHSDCFEDVVDAVEAKLKEKNK